jgi:hypothetical protein
MEKIWSEEQVKNLKKRQEFTRLHPYTCICGEVLGVTSYGLVCRKCGYTQTWALEDDLDGTFIVDMSR